MAPEHPLSVGDLCIGTFAGLGTVLVAPKADVEMIRSTRAALNGCETWGDARRLLSPERFAELEDSFGGDDDSEPLELPEIDDEDGLWPRLFYRQIPRWLPSDLLERYGDSYSTMLDSGVNIPDENYEELLNALRERGVNVSEDADLEEVFDVAGMY